MLHSQPKGLIELLTHRQFPLIHIVKDMTRELTAVDTSHDIVILVPTRRAGEAQTSARPKMFTSGNVSKTLHITMVPAPIAANLPRMRRNDWNHTTVQTKTDTLALIKT